MCEEKTSDVLVSKVEISFKLTTKTKCGVKFGKDVCVRIKWQFFCVESVFYFSLTHKYTTDKLQDKPTKVS